MKIYALALAMIGLAAPAMAATVDFEGQGFGFKPNGLTINGMTFSGLGNAKPYTYDMAAATEYWLRPENIGQLSSAQVTQMQTHQAMGLTTFINSCLVSSNARGRDCHQQTLKIDFAQKIDEISFDAIFDESSDSVLKVGITNAAGTSMRELKPFDGSANTVDRITISGLGGATSLTLWTSDPTGVNYDNITSTPSPVPLPAGAVLMGTALGGLGLMRRRKS